MALLFWKSLPVSDLTTVLSKASIPLVVLPLIAYLLSLATVVILLFLSTAVLLGSRVSPAVLWAALPPFAVSVAERIAFGTSHFAALVGYRLSGAMTRAFAAGSQDGNIDRLAQLDPARFLTTPGLWIGLVAAASFLSAAARLRRYREPI